MADTTGERVYLVRLALGDGIRKAMPMRDFAALLTTMSGRSYGASTVSDIETDQRSLTLEEVTLIAEADPLARGRAWLAWGELPDSDNGGHGARKHYPPAQIGEGYPVTGPSPKAQAEAEDAERRRRKLGNGG